MSQKGAQPPYPEKAQHPKEKSKGQKPPRQSCHGSCKSLSVRKKFWGLLAL